MTKAKKAWLISKCDDGQKVWERQIPLYRMTSLQVGELLKRLASTLLTDVEVMDCADPSLGGQRLIIQSNGETIVCGKNPYFSAEVIVAE